jgi:hypothetical protein
MASFSGESWILIWLNEPFSLLNSSGCTSLASSLLQVELARVEELYMLTDPPIILYFCSSILAACKLLID